MEMTANLDRRGFHAPRESKIVLHQLLKGEGPMKLIRSGTRGLALLLAVAGLMLVAPAAQAVTRPASFSFDLVPSAPAAACLPHARGEVRLTSHGPNQQMDVRVSGLPVNNTFTL